MRAVRTVVAAVLCAACLLAGCADMQDINQRALVVGAAIDALPSPEAYNLTVQFQSPTSGSQGGGGMGGTGGSGGQSSECQSVAGAGSNIGSAVTQVRSRTDKFIYFGTLSVIVLGDQLASRGVFAPLDYFLGAGEVAEGTQLVVAQGQAAQLFQGPCPTNGPAFRLFQYLLLAEHSSIPTADNPLWRFLASQFSRSQASWLPLVAPAPSQSSPFDDLGDALFVAGRMVGQLHGYQGEVFDLLVKQGGFPYVLVSLPGLPTPATLQVRSVQRQISVQGPGAVTLSMTISTFFRESPDLRVDDRDVRALEQAAATQLQAQLRGVLNSLQSFGADVLGFSDYVHARYPQAVNDWPQQFRHLKIRLDVRVHIREGGRKI